MLGGQLGDKLTKFTLFGGKGAVDVYTLLTKVNKIMNWEEVKEEKYSDVKACVGRIWENLELQEKWGLTGSGKSWCEYRGHLHSWRRDGRASSLED